MGKALAGALVAAIAAAIAFFIWWSVNSVRQEDMLQQIAAMNRELSQLSGDNTQLKGELAKVQTEEQNLAAQNEDLRKAIATVKATGKLPPDLPYPPK